MKVYIGKYRYHWISPYTILEKVLFWKDWDNIDYDEPWVKKWSDRLLPFSTGLQKFLDFVHPQIEYVKIDRWDTWSMDHTLGVIVLPMLKQLQKTKHGSPLVDDEDVPDNLKSTNAKPKENEYDIDEFHHDRWDWVMNEMIFAFESQFNDWQEQFHSGEHDIKWSKTENIIFNPITGKDEVTYEMKKGPNDTYKCDFDGMAEYQKRITNGYRLFGRYFEALWD